MIQTAARHAPPSPETMFPGTIRLAPARSEDMFAGAISRRPLRADVADRLRKAIQDGTLPPSSNLKETEASQGLGVSRTPAREAFVQLECEGYLVAEAGHGFRVSALSIEDAIQIERLVGALERLAMEESAPPSERELAALQRAQKTFAEARSAGNRQALDERWHALLIARCENRWARRYLEQLKGHMRRYQQVYTAAAGNHARSIREHNAILARLKKGDVGEAAALVESHWVGGIARLAAEGLLDLD